MAADQPQAMTPEERADAIIPARTFQDEPAEVMRALIADTIRQAEKAGPLPAIRQAVADYHLALDNREHGDVAAHRLVVAVEAALGAHWVQGAEKARRAAAIRSPSTDTPEGGQP